MPAPATLSSQLELLISERIAGDVRVDEMTLGLYSTDASIYQMKPAGVVFPRSTADVREVVRIARQHGVPLLARGAGTSLSGQTITPGLVLDFTRYMNRILEVDADRGLVRVEAGVVLDQLNAELQPRGLQFGPDVATSNRASLGGMIGNNSAGSRSVQQGKTIDHVRELRVVLADGSEVVFGPVDAAALAEKRKQTDLEGEIYRHLEDLVSGNRREILSRYPRILRRVSGYNLDAFVPELCEQYPVPESVAALDRQWNDRRQFNLAKLIVGAEGTLGVVTEAVLHAVPLPRERGVACLQFTTIDAALDSVGAILDCRPSAVELLDRNIVELSRQNLKYKTALDFIEGVPEAILIVEFSGDVPVQIADALQLLEQRMQGRPGLQKLILAENAAQRDRIWNCRKAGAPLLLSIPGARKPIAFVEDTAVAPTQLPKFTRRFREILDRHGITGAYFGHASVGCLHIRPMLDTKSVRDLEILRRVSDEIAELVREFGGAMTGEHGDGLARSYHNLKLFGPKLFGAFGEVKRLFDPQGILNPGKVAATPSPIDHLRYGPAYRGTAVESYLDFRREAEFAEAPGQGFLAAAEMCNGSGVCRKTNSGTMCPSFMVTRDEEHSTRGRANALRLALSGQLPAGALTSQRMFEVMDLCLMCKGCKAECPSNVDVAKLKMEFLAQYYTHHQVPVQTWMTANVAWINRIGSACAPFSNWLPNLMSRQTLQFFSGVDPRRSLPKFYRKSFGKWFRKHHRSAEAGTAGRVVLLDDCLTSHCEPGVNRAAVNVLEAAGYEVVLAGLWCCGRPLISKGLLDSAKSLVRQNVAKLVEYVDQGLPILGSEPSCVLTLADEYPDLFPSEATRRVQRNAFLVEDWLANQFQNDGRLLALQPLAGNALYHGHCQQKAIAGTQGARACLSQIPELKVHEVDSGCCGMAGAFGYDHYDLSMQIGERVLFPTVREHEAGPVVASGFSCRHQIVDGTGRTAVHPLELLAQQLVVSGSER